jgi:hypothetical protein
MLPSAKPRVCRVGNCPQCNKQHMLAYKCDHCGKLFCKYCSSYTLIPFSDVSYKTPEYAKFLCKKCKTRVYYKSSKK